MLTPEQINKAREAQGLKSLDSSGKPKVSLADITDVKPVAPEKGLLEKSRDVAVNIVGGGKLAEGAGKAIAASQTQDRLSEAELANSDIALNLQKLIIKNKKDGKDTTRLESALNQLKFSQAESSEVGKEIVADLPTDKEVIGSAVRLAGTVGAGALAKGASALTKVGEATSVIGGAVRGAGAGILAGGTEGAIQGAGLAAEQNKSSEEILASGLIGGATGAVLGGAIGTVTGGITGGVKAAKIKKENFASNLVSEPLSSKERAEAIYRGRLKDPTLFSKAEVELSKRDLQLGESVKDVVNPKATIGENVDAIRNKISSTDTGVRDYIIKNKVPFNTRQLQSQLETGKGDLELVFASDAQAEKTYDAVSKAFLRTIDKKDTAGLFEARQNFDQLPAVKKLLDSDKLGENARKEIVLAVRRSANEYISSLLPKGNPYKGAMKLETFMQEALGNLASRSKDIIGKNKLQLLIQEYPVLNWVIGGVATGIVGGAGVGVGASIVGSSD